MKYQGKKAVVTGGTHGMGRAVVDKLLGQGAEVLLTGRKADDVEHGISMDATNLADIDKLATAARERFGSIDLLFINVGYATLFEYQDVTPDDYDRTFDINTRGAFFTAQKLAPLVAEGGSIVFTTSVAQTGGGKAMSAYSGAKAAVRSFGRSFAAELAPRNVRVNVVSPGFIDTPSMGVTGLPQEALDAFKQAGDELTPLKRHGTSDEVADAVLFLAFEATFTTGADLPVDGGIGQSLSV
ncbi:short-chain dehydrogenase [Lentzea guizhouensis]|uniref:Short-chain dehydrogenase n=1 Tax=Lentzea guizhouensis TaxID=1586287 RepID=A0A1B2HIL3_9PSEU|nr:SDR family oxidoreductase [Lentzea guizhouensis]ANZ37547.1 short-chain dehydrogenase [Lentzea guizhouensis]